MNRIFKIFIYISAVIYPFSAYSQGVIDPKKFFGDLGRNANTYFLSANRPSYSTSAYLNEKGSYEISIDPSFNSSAVEVPISFSFVLSKKIELSAGIVLFNQTYKFDGKKVSGIGDANIGFKYKLQESSKFSHAFQIIVKIPTASESEQIGTGHPDYHFGIAEGFNYKRFGYELSLELGMLHRRNVPAQTTAGGVFTQAILDSINTLYNYKFEPEISATFSPSVNFSDNFLLYSGISVSRNTKLDYNWSTFYFGLGYSPLQAVSLSIGASTGLEKGSSWDVNTGISFSFK